MATKIYDKWSFFPSTVVQGAGAGGGIIANGWETANKYPLKGEELNDVIFHLAEFARESMSAKDFIEGMGETYDPNNQPQQLNDVLAKIAKASISYPNNTAPTATDDNTKGYKLGDTWIDTSKNPEEPYILINDATGAAVWQKIGSGSGGAVSDASETQKGIIEIATQAEVNAGTDAVRAVTPKTFAGSKIVGTKAGVPVAGDFTGNIKEIVDTTNADIYVLDGTDVKKIGGQKSNATNTVPNATNDNTQGYSLGSVWVDTTNGDNIVYICTDDSTGAAKWIAINKTYTAAFAQTGPFTARNDGDIWDFDNVQWTDSIDGKDIVSISGGKLTFNVSGSYLFAFTGVVRDLNPNSLSADLKVVTGAGASVCEFAYAYNTSGYYRGTQTVIFPNIAVGETLSLKASVNAGSCQIAGEQCWITRL